MSEKTFIDDLKAQDNEQLIFLAALAAKLYDINGEGISKDEKDIIEKFNPILDEAGITYEMDGDNVKSITFWNNKNGENIGITVEAIEFQNGDNRTQLFSALNQEFEKTFRSYSNDLRAGNSEARLMAVALEYSLQEKPGQKKNNLNLAYEQPLLDKLDDILTRVDVEFTKQRGPKRNLNDGKGGINVDKTVELELNPSNRTSNYVYTPNVSPSPSSPSKGK